MKDLNEILGMASRVQEELQRAQDNLDKLEVEGAAGGGLVKVKASPARPVGKADARRPSDRRVQRRAQEGGRGQQCRNGQDDGWPALAPRLQTAVLSADVREEPYNNPGFIVTAL
jgi:hypothetical protein